MRTPRWTRHDVSDPGVTLIELLASSADALDRYQDRVAEEQRRARRWRAATVAAAAIAVTCLVRSRRR